MEESIANIQLLNPSSEDVIVLTIDTDKSDYSDMQVIADSLRIAFPNNQILLIPDNVSNIDSYSKEETLNLLKKCISTIENAE